MNMFSKKQNPSGVRRTDRVLKKNAPMKIQYGTTNDEKTLSKKSAMGQLETYNEMASVKSLINIEESADLYGIGLTHD